MLLREAVVDLGRLPGIDRPLIDCGRVLSAHQQGSFVEVGRDQFGPGKQLRHQHRDGFWPCAVGSVWLSKAVWATSTRASQVRAPWSRSSRPSVPQSGSVAGSGAERACRAALSTAASSTVPRPRIFTPPLRKLEPRTAKTEQRTLGYAVIDFATEVCGVDLFPWQKWLLIHALELLPDGSFRYRNVVVLVARQNGKSTLSQALADRVALLPARGGSDPAASATAPSR